MPEREPSRVAASRLPASRMLQGTRGAGAPPDPVLRYSVPLFRGFVRYLQWYVGRHFHAVLMSASGIPRVAAGKPLIIYSNHPSWWDPLLFVLIGATLFPERRGFGPMEARSLERYAIFERLGAFGVDLATARGGLAFMLQSRRILAHGTSILWLTAEGAFRDVRQRPVKLQDGLGYLARTIPEVMVLPLALEFPFWNESRPVALCRFGAPMEAGALNGGGRSAAEWTALFEQALTHTMDELARDSAARSAAAFRSLLAGTAGVGGFYDGWRRLRAWSRGKRFEASHEPRE